jgi:cell division protein FtsW
MPLDKFKQRKNGPSQVLQGSGRGAKKRDLVSPTFHSPALASVERERRGLVIPDHAMEGDYEDYGQPGIPTTPADWSFPDAPDYAIDFSEPTLPVDTDLTTGRRHRADRAVGGQRTAELPPQPKQSLDSQLSADEQKKLAALEMSLPRVAGHADPILLIVVLVLVCIGLVMVYSASSFAAARDYGDAAYYFQKQLVGAVLGVVVMLITMRIDYRIWRRFSLFGLAVALPLLAVVLVVGSNAYGATRWLQLGFFSFQPSELIKLVLALYIADWLARKGNQVSTFLYGLAPFVLLIGLILGLVLLQKDMGTACVIAALAVVMFFTAGANIFQFLLAVACGTLVFLTQAFRGYRYYRLIGFLQPFQHTTDINLQLYQSLLALGSGGWLGVGLGASRQKTGYLPFPFIDSIFAIIGEELGFIGCIIIILLFVILAFRGFRLARRTQDIYGALLATGITTWLVVQAMINIGASTGTIPYTGVPLPFISFGGTSMVISLAGVGVLLSISRYIQEPEDPALSKQTIEKIRIRRTK